MKKIKVAVCQMAAKLGDVPHNLMQAEQLVDEAFSMGAKWVILPEFFPSAMAYHPKMEQSIQPLEGQALSLLQRAATRHCGYVGGSYLARWKDEVYNSFVLVRPDGSYEVHNKDIPTVWENCYYRGGNDDGIIETEEMTVGAVQCAEFTRWQTYRRLFGRVECVLGCSAWGSYPDLFPLKKLFSRHEQDAIHLVKQCFAQMARVLGVPVLHAGQAGSFQGIMPLVGLPYPSYYLGDSQIVDGSGRVLALLDREQGAGVACATVEIGTPQSSEPIGDGFWTIDLPWSFKLIWTVFNAHGRYTYRRNKKARLSRVR